MAGVLGEGVTSVCVTLATVTHPGRMGPGKALTLRVPLRRNITTPLTAFPWNVSREFGIYWAFLFIYSLRNVSQFLWDKITRDAVVIYFPYPYPAQTVLIQVYLKRFFSNVTPVR